jgi:hypothetical protein
MNEASAEKRLTAANHDRDHINLIRMRAAGSSDLSPGTIAVHVGYAISHRSASPSAGSSDGCQPVRRQTISS